MATITVDTDGTSGDYAGIVAGIAALPDPLTEDLDLELYASTGVADTLSAIAVVDVDTTSAYRLRIIQKDDNYVLECDGPNYLRITGSFGHTSHVTLQGAVLKKTNIADHYAMSLQAFSIRTGDVIIDGCTFIGGGGSTYRSRMINLDPRSGDTGISFTFQNNLVYNPSSLAHDYSSILYASVASTMPVHIYNNTLIGGYHAFSSIITPSNWLFKNNLMTFTNTFGATVSTSSDYNSVEAAAATGGTNDRVSQTFTFDDAANDDYHLASTDAGAIGYGVGPSTDSDVPTLDFDDVTRSGTTCDIGAFEYVASGTGVNISPAAQITIVGEVSSLASSGISPAGVLLIDGEVAMVGSTTISPAATVDTQIDFTLSNLSANISPSASLIIYVAWIVTPVRVAGGMLKYIFFRMFNKGIFGGKMR